MLLDFFSALRGAGVPVSIREWLDLHGALERNLAEMDMDAFYFLSRAVLVKDERHFDIFDRTFSAYFSGLQAVAEALESTIPDDWLRKTFERSLSPEERAQLQGLGGLDKLIEAFRQRLEEQKARHAGGNKWIGTGGTSPFGSGGYHPEGIRVGDAGERQGKAVKVWDQRQYRDLDDQVELGTRNIKLALRRLRKFARQGAAEELDLGGTIESTARDGGLLNIQLRPERRNTIKLLLLLDIGGSMDAHVRVCEELFSACRSEFKHFEHFYFHNCPYETLWKHNLRRHSERIDTFDLLHTYGSDYKVVFVGDAAMAPYEITHAGGSVEHWNEEAGAVWLKRLAAHFGKLIWLNPYPVDAWQYSTSNALVRELIQERMFPMTMAGLEDGIRCLGR